MSAFSKVAMVTAFCACAAHPSHASEVMIASPNRIAILLELRGRLLTWCASLGDKKYGNARRPKRSDHAGGEHAAEPGMLGEVAEGRRAESESHIKKGG